MRISLNSRIAPMRSSSYRTFQTCPRQFMFRYRLGLEKKGEHAKALHIGKLLHTMVSGWYLGESEKACVGAAAVEHAECLAHLLDLAAQQNGKIWGKPIEEVVRELEKQFALAHVMFVVFQHKYSGRNELRGCEPLTDLIEQPLEVLLPGRAVPLRGRMDLPLVNHATKTLHIWDLKTLDAKEDTRRRASGVERDIAMHIYRELLEAHKPPEYKAYPVKSVYHFIMHKPSIHQKRAESWDEYVDRVRLWYDNRDLKFRENPTECSPPMHLGQTLFRPTRPGWVNTAFNDFEVACRQRVDDNLFVPNRESCFKYNRACPYLDLCEQDPVLWPTTTRAHFTQAYREDSE